MQVIANNMDTVYYELCQALLLKGDDVTNTRELRNVQFTLTNVENNVVGNRDISLPYAFGELVWYFTGSNSVEFISKFGSLWKKISDDGVTSNSAYGYILMDKYGFNQIQKIIELLRADPHSRRAVMNINVPNENVIETKDEPCTIALQFLIRNNKLTCTTMMRSNDIWFGVPYDVIFFTEIQKYIAMELGIECGDYNHFATSLHAYEKDFSKVKSVKERGEKHIKLNISNLLEWKQFIYDETMIAKDPKDFVVRMFDQFKIYEEI